MGVLGLVLGQRPDIDVLKDKERKCMIEASFNISKYHLQKFFVEAGMVYEEETILRREILPNGKTRGFVNDSHVGIKLLKELGLRLIFILKTKIYHWEILNTRWGVWILMHSILVY